MSQLLVYSNMGKWLHSSCLVFLESTYSDSKISNSFYHHGPDTIYWEEGGAKGRRALIPPSHFPQKMAWSWCDEGFKKKMTFSPATIIWDSFAASIFRRHSWILTFSAWNRCCFWTAVSWWWLAGGKRSQFCKLKAHRSCAMIWMLLFHKNNLRKAMVLSYVTLCKTGQPLTFNLDV